MLSEQRVIASASASGKWLLVISLIFGVLVGSAAVLWESPGEQLPVGHARDELLK